MLNSVISLKVGDKIKIRRKWYVITDIIEDNGSTWLLSLQHGNEVIIRVVEEKEIEDIRGNKSLAEWW